MITDNYCSYEVAKLLKEKGFDIEVGGMYVNKDNNFVHSSLAPLKVKDYEKVFDDQFIPTCTHQIAMKWLREKGIDITIMPIHPTEINPTKRYMWELDSKETHKRGIEDTYEAAVEAALKYALEKFDLNMKIYIVTNEAERYDSIYHDILEVFDTMEKATTYMRTSADDFVTMCDNGDGFDNYTIETEFPNTIIIRNDDTGYEYEAWYVDIYEVH